MLFRLIGSLLLSACCFHAQNDAAKKQDALMKEQIAEANRIDRNPQYFPKTLDPLSREWYHQQLAAAQQPSLYAGRNSGKSRYRFDWIPSFHHSIFALVELHPDGTGELQLTRLSGLGGYKPGKVDGTKSLKLSSDQVRRFNAAVDSLKFWSLPDGDMTSVRGDDGSEWVLEGVRNSSYHIMQDWSPKKGALHDLGVLLVRDFGGWTDKYILSY